MKTVASGPGPDKSPDDGRVRVVITALPTAGGFLSAAAPVLMICGPGSLNDGTVRYVVTTGGAVLVVALLVAVCFLAPPRWPAPIGGPALCRCRTGRTSRRRQRRRGRPATRVPTARTRP